MHRVDLNADGVVDADDLAMLLERFGDASRPGARIADLNRDGVVDELDLAILVDAFGRTPDEGDTYQMLRVSGGHGDSCAPSVDPAEDGPGGPDCEGDGGDGVGGDGEEVPGGKSGTTDPLPPGGDGGGGSGGGGDPPCPVSVTINGLPEASLCIPPAGQQLEVNLLATGVPEGGAYAWSVGAAAGTEVIVDGDQLTLRITEPGEYTVSVVYSVPDCGSKQATGDFTVSGAYLAVHRPKVIDPMESQIPRSQQITKGVQTFVNLDNDDRDDKFDLGLQDTEVKNEAAGVLEDNELVKVRLVLPGDLTEGSASLQAAAGAANILVWQAPHKGEQYALGQSLTIPTDFEAEEGSLVKTLWVEGVAPHTQQQGTRLRLIVDSPQLDCPNADEASATVIGVEKVEWVGRGNSVNDDDALDPDPNWPAGLAPGSVRVFSGARFVGGSVEQSARDRVDVKVTLSVKPVEPVTMHLRSFDVDDPTADAFPLDNESDPEDNRGLTPARSGMFEGEGPDGVKAHLFAEKEELVRFQTTMQPGDNFRVVVNGDRKFLLDLHNNDNELGAADADKQRIVNTHVFAAPGTTPEQAEVRESSKYVSDVLTVWRILHLEVDSMEPVKDNFIEGHIMALNTDDSSTAEAVFVDANLDDGSPHLLATPQGNGRFENGSLRIAGTHDVGPINGNSDNGFARLGGLNICAVPLPFIAHDVIPDPGVVDPAWTISGTVARVRDNTRLEVTIAAGVLDAGAVGGVIRIGDGDWMAIVGVTPSGGGNPVNEVRVDALRVPFRAVDDDSPEGTPIPRPDTSRMAGAFEPAYILPRESVLPGDEQLSFIANIQDFDGEAARMVGWDYTNSALRSPRFWIVYIRRAFQGDTRLDNDPNVEGLIFGIALISLPAGTPSFGGINIYWEAHNEASAVGLATPNLPGHGFQEMDTVVHEVGHLFGCLHSDAGVMGDDDSGLFDSIDFTITSLNAIRSRIHP